MRHSLRCLMIWLAPLAVCGQAAAIPPEKIESVEVIRCPNLVSGEPDSRLDFVVCEPVLANEPAWTPADSSPPPLAISKAVAISFAEIVHYEDPSLDWKIHAVVVKEVIPLRWVYLVRWGAFDGARYEERKLTIPVLMSGRTVEGKARRLRDATKAR